MQIGDLYYNKSWKAEGKLVLQKKLLHSYMLSVHPLVKEL